MKVLKRHRRASFIAILLIVLVVIAFVVQRLFAPPSGRIFSDSVGRTCIYQVRVMAFADDNGDGVQNPGETGIAGVMVSLQHSKPFDHTPEANMTDADGAVLLQADKYCSSDDQLTVNVDLPSGYSATTPLSFGPYPVPEFDYDTMTQAKAHPIPDRIEVGLRRN